MPLIKVKVTVNSPRKRALLAEKFWHALAAKETALLVRVNGLTAKLDVTYVA